MLILLKLFYLFKLYSRFWCAQIRGTIRCSKLFLCFFHHTTPVVRVHASFKASGTYQSKAHHEWIGACSNAREIETLTWVSSTLNILTPPSVFAAALPFFLVGDFAGTAVCLAILVGEPSVICFFKVVFFMSGEAPSSSSVYLLFDIWIAAKS